MAYGNYGHQPYRSAPAGDAEAAGKSAFQKMQETLRAKVKKEAVTSDGPSDQNLGTQWLFAPQLGA
jgi:hypothetical protein